MFSQSNKKLELLFDFKVVILIKEKNYEEKSLALCHCCAQRMLSLHENAFSNNI